MADFTWALATRLVQSMPTRSPPRMRSGGSRRSPEPSTVAPMSSSGSATRSIGRSDSEASPTSSVSHPKPATIPASNRMEVPEFPQSIGPVGACSRLRPPWRTTSPPGVRSTSTPMASTAPSVQATSAPSERPWTTEVPSARAARSTDRCEIDFSPGVRTEPWHAVPPGTTSVRGALMRAVRRDSGSPGARWPRTTARRPPNRPPGSGHRAVPPPSGQFRCRRC